MQFAFHVSEQISLKVVLEFALMSPLFVVVGVSRAANKPYRSIGLHFQNHGPDHFLFQPKISTLPHIKKPPYRNREKRLLSVF